MVDSRAVVWRWPRAYWGGEAECGGPAEHWGAAEHRDAASPEPVVQAQAQPPMWVQPWQVLVQQLADRALSQANAAPVPTKTARTRADFPRIQVRGPRQEGPGFVSGSVEL